VYEFKREQKCFRVHGECFRMQRSLVRAIDAVAEFDRAVFDPVRLDAMWKVYAPAAFEHEVLFSAPYLLASEGLYRVYFAPFASAPEPSARLILVGLTPGYAQAALVAKVFCEVPLAERRDDEHFAGLVRSRVAFEGSTRSNLCAMLDDLGLPAVLGLRDSRALFDPGRTDVATTSALLYPVVRGFRAAKFRRW